MNKYVIPNIPGANPTLLRVIQDLADRVNYLQDELEVVRGVASDVTGLAAAQRPVPGVLAIPSSGENGFIRINKDGVITSYANPVESLFPYIDLTIVSSSGVGPDVLHTFNLPANSLQTDGDYLSVWYAGNFAANVRGKAVNAQFDGQTYEGAGVTDIQAAIGWVMNVRIMRLSATSVRISHLLTENAIGVSTASVATSYSTGGNMFTRNQDLTGIANLNSSMITMRVRSVVQAGAVAGDVYQNKSIIELIRPRTRKLV